MRLLSSASKIGNKTRATQLLSYFRSLCHIKAVRVGYMTWMRDSSLSIHHVLKYTPARTCVQVGEKKGCPSTFCTVPPGPHDAPCGRHGGRAAIMRYSP